jgi:hypothetical protein
VLRALLAPELRDAVDLVVRDDFAAPERALVLRPPVPRLAELFAVLVLRGLLVLAPVDFLAPLRLEPLLPVDFVDFAMYVLPMRNAAPTRIAHEGSLHGQGFHWEFARISGKD